MSVELLTPEETARIIVLLEWRLNEWGPVPQEVGSAFDKLKRMSASTTHGGLWLSTERPPG